MGKKKEAENLPATRTAGPPATLQQALGVDQEELANHYVALVEKHRALVKKDVAYLGDRQAFVRRDGEGQIMAVKGRIALTKQNNQVYAITTWEKGDDGKSHPVVRWNRTLQGINICNKIPGVSCGMPDRLFVDGQYVENPRRIIDHETGALKRVIVCVVVQGRSPATGNIEYVKYTLDYDPKKDLLHMLADVADKYPNQVEWGTKKEKPVGAEREVSTWTGYGQNRKKVAKKVKPHWTFIPSFDSGGDIVGLWYDIKSPEVQKKLTDYINLCEHAVKKAQSVAERNAKKKHSALAEDTATADENGNVGYTLIGWTSQEDDTAKLDDVCQAMSDGRDVKTVAADATVVEEAHVYDAEEDGQDTTVVDAEDLPQQEAGPDEGAESVAGPTELQKGAADGLGLLNLVEQSAARETSGVGDKAVGQMSDEECQAVVKAVTEIMDSKT